MEAFTLGPEILSENTISDVSWQLIGSFLKGDQKGSDYTLRLIAILNYKTICNKSDTKIKKIKQQKFQ